MLDLLQLIATILACVFIGIIAYGFLSGIAIHAYKRQTDNSYAVYWDAKRAQRFRAYKRTGHIARNASTMTFKAAMCVPAVKLGVQDGRRNVEALKRSQLNPYNRLTVWRPFRSAMRCYGDIWKDARKHPRKYERSLYYGVSLARRFK